MDVYNLIILFLSVIIVLVSGYSIKKYGLRPSQIFLISFYFCLSISCFKLSIYQIDKNFRDIYYFIITPFFFVLPIFCCENLPIVKVKYSKLDISLTQIYWVLLVIFICLKLYISKTVGWRIESIIFANYLMSGDNFVISGYSGLAGVLQWTLVILLPYTNKKQRAILIILVIIFSVLHVKRGDIIRLFSFLLCFYLFNVLKKNSLSLKRIFRFSLYISLILFVFVFTGNIRQEARGDEASNLAQNVGIKHSSSLTAWSYGYFFINYEVVRGYYELNHDFKFTTLNSLVKGDEDDKEYLEINGFNAATFLSEFIWDSGHWCIIELLIFGIIIGILVYLSRIANFDGLYIFMDSLLLMAFFGNYLSIRSIMFSIIFSIFIFSIFTNKLESKK